MENKQATVLLRFILMWSPINNIYYEDSDETYDSSFILNDPYIKKYNCIGETFYNGCFQLESGDFKQENITKFKDRYFTFLRIGEFIVNRLNKIQDGSFKILNKIETELQKDYKSIVGEDIPRVVNYTNEGKLIVTIDLDYLYGPLKYSDEETAIPTTGNKLIDNDEILQKLNLEASRIYNALYVDAIVNDKYIFFDKVNFKKNKVYLRELIDEVLNRLNEINDGSYVILDKASKKLK